MEQHTHPSPISTNSAAPCIFGPSVSSRSRRRAVILASMFTAAMSLTTTPTFESLSCEASSSRFLNSVVLPVPKNPERSVTGTLVPGSATVDGERAQPTELLEWRLQRPDPSDSAGEEEHGGCCSACVWSSRVLVCASLSVLRWLRALRFVSRAEQRYTRFAAVKQNTRGWRSGCSATSLSVVPCAPPARSRNQAGC